MLGVSNAGEVSIIVSSASLMPRSNPKRRTRLIKEHGKRQGDPAPGGSTKVPIMTAYRQEALACADALSGGPLRPRDLIHRIRLRRKVQHALSVRLEAQ